MPSGDDDEIAARGDPLPFLGEFFFGKFFLGKIFFGKFFFGKFFFDKFLATRALLECFTSTHLWSRTIAR